MLCNPWYIPRTALFRCSVQGNTVVLISIEWHSKTWSGADYTRADHNSASTKSKPGNWGREGESERLGRGGPPHKTKERGGPRKRRKQRNTWLPRSHPSHSEPCPEFGCEARRGGGGRGGSAAVLQQEVGVNRRDRRRDDGTAKHKGCTACTSWDDR